MLKPTIKDTLSDFDEVYTETTKKELLEISDEDNFDSQVLRELSKQQDNLREEQNYDAS